MCGYLEKGAKRWIEDNLDIESMYEAFKDRDCEITLWCICEKRGKKRKPEELEDVTPSKRQSKEERVEEIAQELRGEEYTLPQLQLWAHMKLNGQHSSMEHPPYSIIWRSYDQA